MFKRGMKGVYQHCGKQHLHRHAAEYGFRCNNRTANGADDQAGRRKPNSTFYCTVRAKPDATRMRSNSLHIESAISGVPAAIPLADRWHILYKRRNPAPFLGRVIRDLVHTHRDEPT